MERLESHSVRWVIWLCACRMRCFGPGIGMIGTTESVDNVVPHQCFVPYEKRVYHVGNDYRRGCRAYLWITIWPSSTNGQLSPSSHAIIMVTLNTGVVIDGAGFALHAARGHSEHDVGLIARSNFVFDTITNMSVHLAYVIKKLVWQLNWSLSRQTQLIRQVLRPCVNKWAFFREFHTALQEMLICFTGVALLYFDHAITLPLEIRRIWCTRFTGASLLFLINRYVPAFGYVPVVLGLFNPPWNIHVSLVLCIFFSSEVLTTFSNVFFSNRSSVVLVPQSWIFI